RPRLVAKGSPDRDAVTAGIRAEVANLPEGSVVLTADESHVSLLAWLRATWVLIGTRQKIWTPGKNKRRTIWGALDVATGAWHYMVTIGAVSAQFIDFCTTLLAAYPNAPTVAVITDGDTTHTSKITQKWVETQPRLKLLIGAAYSPQDNPTERIWGALK